MKQLALAAFVALIPSAAFADPFIDALYWDSCAFAPATSISKTFSGPGVYHQVVSGLGFGQPVSGHQVRIRVTSSNVFGGGGVAPLPDAWRFDAAGCAAGRAFADADHAEVPCPSLSPVGTGGTLAASLLGNDVILIYDQNYAIQSPNPGTRYSLFGLDFDLTLAGPGAQSPPLCGNADSQVCFVIEGGTWTDAAGGSHPIGFAPFQGVSWQDGPGVGCFGDLPVDPTTWGRLRSLYR